MLYEAVAASSASKLIQSGNKNLEKSTLITFKLDLVRNYDDSSTEYRYGMCINVDLEAASNEVWTTKMFLVSGLLSAQNYKIISSRKNSYV